MPNEMMTAEAAFDMYRNLVEGNDQAIPMLAYCTQENELCVLALAIQTGDDDNPDMQEVLTNVLAMAREKIGLPKWLIFSAESWIATYDPTNGEEPPGEYGDLNRRAKAGEELTECAMITGVGMDDQWSYIVPFVRGKDGDVTWDEPNMIPAIGGVPDLMRDALSQ